MDLALAYTGLLWVGKMLSQKRETAPIEAVVQEDNEFKLPLPRNSAKDSARERLGEDQQIDIARFPGTQVNSGMVHRSIRLREHKEFHVDNSGPLIGNVHQTIEPTKEFETFKPRVHEKRFNLENMDIPDSSATGTEDAGRIARSERIEEIRREHRNVIASRALQQCTRKTEDASETNRPLAMTSSTIPTGLNKATGGEVTVLRVHREKTRTNASSQFPSVSTLPEVAGNHFIKERLLHDDYAPNPTAMWQSQLVRPGLILQHPGRSDKFLNGERTTLSNSQQREDDPTRHTVNTHWNRKQEQTSQEQKAIYYFRNINGHSNTEENSKRDRRVLLGENKTTVTGMWSEPMHRPDMVMSSRGGTKKLVENRDPFPIPVEQVGQAQAILPVRPVSQSSTIRGGTREPA